MLSSNSDFKFAFVLALFLKGIVKNELLKADMKNVRPFSMNSKYTK